jgi:hypothetical protein
MDLSTCCDQVRSFLIGTLLGDCYVSKAYQWQWSNTDYDWVAWKADYVKNLLGYSCKISTVKDSTCKNGFMHGFTASSQKGRLKVYADWFYSKDRVKHISDKIRYLDHPIGILALILDQGTCRGGLTLDYTTGNTYYRKPTFRICLNNYPENELEKFQNAILSNFGLNSSLHSKGKDGRMKDVYLDTRSSQKAWSLIKDLVPDIPFAHKKFDPFISQTTNAKYIQRFRGVEIN